MNRLETVGQTVTAVAHDIRGALSVISTSSDLLRQITNRASLNQADKYLHKISSMVDRISKMTDDLNCLGMPSGDELVVSFSINQVIEETLNLSQFLVLKKGMRLKATLVEPDMEVECRPGDISQMLISLIRSVAGAASGAEEHTVELRCVGAQNTIEISVCCTNDSSDDEASPRFVLKIPRFQRLNLRSSS